MKNFKIMAIALSMVAAFAMSAVAADWNFYGSARVATFVTDLDAPGAGTDTKNFDESMQGNSRIGAKVKVSDELIGGFEYGTGVNVRKLYGEWTFGAGKFLVGQTYTPLNWFYSNQVYGGDEGLISYGAVYAGRQPMLRLTFGNFQIAAVETASKVIGAGTIEKDLPKIEAAYKYNFGQGFVEVGAGYNSYEMVGAGVSNDIDSYVLALGAGFNFANIKISGNIMYGQNMGPYGMATAVDRDPVISGSTVIDNDSLGYILVASAKINEMFTVEAGYGYTESELDVAGAKEDEAASYYVNTTVTLAPGVFFVPELGYIDNKQDNAGAEESEILYYGIKWQINF